jgi:hypothetical protein
LQLIAFHDPDDALSYNLQCWYFQSVLKNHENTKRILKAEAKRRYDRNPDRYEDQPGLAMRKVRDEMFDVCSVGELDGFRSKELFRSIWEPDKGNQTLVEFKDATVRLNGYRLKGLIAHPMNVHSNYFSDATIHTWIAKGYHH